MYKNPEQYKFVLFQSNQDMEIIKVLLVTNSETNKFLKTVTELNNNPDENYSPIYMEQNMERYNEVFGNKMTKKYFVMSQITLEDKICSENFCYLKPTRFDINYTDNRITIGINHYSDQGKNLELLNLEGVTQDIDDLIFDVDQDKSNIHNIFGIERSSVE